jgi:uncharacterized metal-binding protein YceD (DUF177 family)
MTTSMNAADPWHARVAVAQIPDTGLHRAFEANETVREAIAKIAGLREILSASASFDMRLKTAGRVHVTGQVKARIGQICVVTLDPIENEIDEQIDLMFAPTEQIPHLSDLVDDATEGDAEVSDPPEPIVDGMIDLGRLATDALLLAIDPYPRRPDAVFESTPEVVDPSDHPFAALKALQSGAEPSSSEGRPKAPSGRSRR